MRSWLERALLVAAVGCLAACPSKPTASPVETADASVAADSGDPSAPLVDAGGHYASFAERPCPPESQLSYQNFGGPFFLDYCQGCHATGVTGKRRNGAPVQVAFDDVAKIHELRQRIWQRAGDDNKTMPPVGKLDPKQRAQLGEWLACGAPAR